MNKKNIINHLTSCPDNELIEILNDVLKSREVLPEEKGYSKHKLAVCLVSQNIESDNDGKESWGSLEFSLVGNHNKDYYGNNEFLGEPFCQEGKCLNCDIQVVSHAKQAICPICNEIVNCT